MQKLAYRKILEGAFAVKSRRFKGTITQSGSRAIISVPFDPNDVWGAKERHYVAGSVSGEPWRGVVESAGTKCFLALGPAWLRDRGLDAGMKVDVELHPEGPQSEDVSPDLSKALNASPEAKAFFDSMPTFYRKNYVRWIESAKRPQTRAARIDETIKSLKAGERRN
jgi:hypothetical protein